MVILLLGIRNDDESNARDELIHKECRGGTKDLYGYKNRRQFWIPKSDDTWNCHIEKYHRKTASTKHQLKYQIVQQNHHETETTVLKVSKSDR